MGFTVKTVPHGPDGGIDATLYKAGRDGPVAVVQCKAWRKPVKVEQVRALAGVMHEHKVLVVVWLCRATGAGVGGASRHSIA
ncbi:restriction endonuclease [Cupriavidus taiwanensis]